MRPQLLKSFSATASVLARVRLNRGFRIEDPDGAWWVKGRRKWSGFILPMGNLLLRWRWAPTKILSLSDWLAWEESVGLTVNRPCRIGIDGLAFPCIDGTAAAELTRAEGRTNRKLFIIAEAAKALAALHRMRVKLPNGGFWPLSHGDATIDNVAWDKAGEKAFWFDFDMRHEFSVKEVLRRADDVRAFVASSSRYFAPKEFDSLLETTRKAYGNRQTMRLAGHYFRRNWGKYDLLHLSQTCGPGR